MPRLRFLAFTLLLCFLLLPTASWSQTDNPGQFNVGATPTAVLPSEPVPTSVTVPPARVGVPSFYEAIDATYLTWARYVQSHYPWWALLLASLVVAYVLGRLLFEACFAGGMFGPRAAAAGFWMFGIWLLPGILMLPLLWPWWAPLAYLIILTAGIAVLVSTLSRKHVA